MKSKSKISFDELDIKCLEELAVVLGVLAATGNKLGRIFSPLYNDLAECLNNNMPKGWQLDKKNYMNTYYPLTGYEYGREKITSLDACFQIENSFTVIKKEVSKWRNYFYVSFGFIFSKEDIDNAGYYYIINKESTTERFEGRINSLSFYQSLKNRTKDYQITVEHPEQGDTSESIELSFKEHSVDKIEAGYNVFKMEILIPFLKTIK